MKTNKYTFFSADSYVVTVTFNNFMKIYGFQIFVGQSTPVQVEKTIMYLNSKWVYVTTWIYYSRDS